MATEKRELYRSSVLLLVALVVSISPGLYGSPTDSSVSRTPMSLIGSHIVGGKYSEIEEVPYQISIETLLTHTCDGAIISDTWVVTAAQCVDWRITLPFFLKRIRVGSTRAIPFFETGGTVHYISQVSTHPKFNYDVIDYDIGVVKMFSRIKLGPRVLPIPIPKLPERTFIDYDKNVTVSGWGTTTNIIGSESMYLKTINVTLTPRDRCNNGYAYHNLVSPRMLCVIATDKPGPCSDSGSSLVHRGQLIGVGSFIFGKSCSVPNLRNVFTNLLDSEIREYIERRTGI